MAVTWSLRRSTDKGVPPSYTIETKFNLPADLHGAEIANVPSILMKQSEQARGTELTGLTVKVMNGYFVIGLSTDETDAQHNEQLLKGRSWLDIPIVYTNGIRAILAMEKGSQGNRTFAEVFAAWEKKWRRTGWFLSLLLLDEPVIHRRRNERAKIGLLVLELTPRTRHTHETARNGRTHTDRRRSRCNGGGCGVGSYVFYVGL
jgi:hypothetical protein